MWQMVENARGIAANTFGTINQGQNESKKLSWDLIV